MNTETLNKSFLEMTNKLTNLGILNNKFFMELFDKDLIGVDPYDPKLSVELKCKIIRECQINIWYFFREVLRIKSPGNGVIKFESNINNIAQIYCASNDKSYLNNGIRQCFKLTTSIALAVYYANFHMKKSIYLSKNKLILPFFNKIVIPSYMNFGYEEDLINITIQDYKSAKISFLNPKFIIIHDYEYIPNIHKIMEYFLKNKSAFILATSTVCDNAAKHGVFNILNNTKNFSYDQFPIEKAGYSIFYIKYDFTLFKNTNEEIKEFLDKWIRILDGDMNALRREILLSRLEGR